MQRSPGRRRYGFIPRHIKHPASRQENPASQKIRSSPSSRPAPSRGRSRAARQRSSMRAFVQKPRKTPSIRISSIGVPGRRSMYSSTRAFETTQSGPEESGSSTTPEIPTASSGEEPTGDLWRQCGDVHRFPTIEDGVRLGGQQPPDGDGLRESTPFRRAVTPLKPGEGRLVGSDQARTRRPRCSCCTPSSARPPRGRGLPSPRTQAHARCRQPCQCAR